MTTRSGRLLFALLIALAIGVLVTLPGYGVLPAGKGDAKAETPAEKKARDEKAKQTKAAPAPAAISNQASPSGDVTWAPVGSVPRAQGDAGLFCRVHIPQGVSAGVIEGQKCMAPGAGGTDASSAQFDVLTGKTAGYRLVAAANPSQVPGAISMGKFANNQGWLCAARQPNNAFALGWATARPPCITQSGNKHQDWNTNLFALAPPAAAAGSAGGPASPPPPGGGAPAGGPPTAAGSNAASPSGDVNWAPVGSVPAPQGDAKFFCRIHNPQGVVGGYIAGQKCVVALGKGISSAQFDVLTGNTQGYRLVPGRPDQVPGAVFVGKWGIQEGWVCAARQPNGGYQMGRTAAGVPCLHFDGQKNVSFTSNLAALAPAAGK